MDNQEIAQSLENIFGRLLKRYGPQYWWPADDPFEVIVGTILTQSVAWKNVRMAISNLKEAGALSPQALRKLETDQLAGLIYSCGYYNAKAKKLKAFALWLGECYNDDLKKLFSTEPQELREKLLKVHGIGEETADSIILYAAGKPAFVADAYTRRILSRLGLVSPKDGYSACQTLLVQNLPHQANLFNEYHALLVCLAKDVCLKVPLCSRCCLGDICQFQDSKLDAKVKIG